MQPAKGCQSIYSATGETVFAGGWDSRALYRAVTGPRGDGHWAGKRVLDIGANTSGLSVEIARRGAYVVAAEPDPYKNTRGLALSALREVIEAEALELVLKSEGLFEAHTLGSFDVILCLGLVYHFRDQQFVLDYLSTLPHAELVISNQTHPGDGMVMVNRMDPSVPVPPKFWDTYQDALSGWHPTRTMFEKMLNYAGYADVQPLTDPKINYPNKPYSGVTNSSYYRATWTRSVDPIASRYTYLPR